MGAILDAIQAKLTAAFQPIRLEIVDDSDRHAGHAGASPGGESHFNVLIESQVFAGTANAAGRCGQFETGGHPGERGSPRRFDQTFLCGLRVIVLNIFFI